MDKRKLGDVLFAGRKRYKKTNKNAKDAAKGLELHLKPYNAILPASECAELDISLKETSILRPHQLESLTKVFVRDRARSGIVALPCGAGKNAKNAAKGLELHLKPYDAILPASECAELDINLKGTSILRPHQLESLTKVFVRDRARSGIVALPCGAGKSLVGVAAACRLQKAVLCLATNAVSVDQWVSQFKLWSNVKDQQIVKFTADCKPHMGNEVGVVVTTYTMLSGSTHAAEAEKVLEWIRGMKWGMLLLDEAHVVPADGFRKILGMTSSYCKLGLTATLVREDQRIVDLKALVEPKLYEGDWQELSKQGYIANVCCSEVRCRMTKEFFREYLEVDDERRKERQDFYALNPNKFRACEYLMEYHEQKKHKVVIFADNLLVLHEYAWRLKRPFVCGSTEHEERTKVINLFRTSDKVNTILLSRVGDNSIDMPEANVIIQVCSHGGSRRQEAQRLGRILRAKGTPRDADGFDAFFYSLVSIETEEDTYCLRRQQFLMEQGYCYKEVNNLPPPKWESQACKPEGEAQFLHKIKTAQKLGKQHQQELFQKMEVLQRNDILGCCN